MSSLICPYCEDSILKWKDEKNWLMICTKCKKTITMEGLVKLAHRRAFWKDLRYSIFGWILRPLAALSIARVVRKAERKR